MSERQFEKNQGKRKGSPNISEEWKDYIIERALTEVKTPRMLLAAMILEQIKQARDRIDKLPERESIAKIISEARNHPKSPLDKPWSIGALVKYPIPPECLPAVLRAFYAERSTDVATDEYFRIGYEFGHETYLTIRQALWIARLSPLFKYPTLEEDIAQRAKFNLVTANLVYWARAYALRERMDEIMGKPVPFDTSNLDMNLLLRATAEIYPSLVSHPSLIRYSWQDTLNNLKKEAQNER